MPPPSRSRGWGCRSSPIWKTAPSGVRLRPGSPRPTRPPTGRHGLRCRPLSGPGSEPRWRGSSSAVSTAGIPKMRRELSGIVSRLSRPATTAVAGYDLTFSPVKSVSSLWALADLPVAAQVEEAHHAAVADALRFLEQHALFTRFGANGIRQVDVQGLVATAFTHRDSRAGDPDLHTHVAVANKVQTLDGRCCRSTAGCCSQRRWRRRRPTTPLWNTTSVSGSGSGSPTGRTVIRGSAGQGDHRHRPGPEPALVGPPTSHRDPAGPARRPVPIGSRPAADLGGGGPARAASHLGDSRFEARTAHLDRSALRLARPGRGCAGQSEGGAADGLGRAASHAS